MAGFNPMSALPPGAAPGDGGFGLTVNHQGAHGPPLGLEAFDQDLGFDESLLYVVEFPPLPRAPRARGPERKRRPEAPPRARC